MLCTVSHTWLGILQFDLTRVPQRIPPFLPSHLHAQMCGICEFLQTTFKWSRNGPSGVDRAQACTLTAGGRWAWLTAFTIEIGKGKERQGVGESGRGSGKRVVELANIYPYKLLAYLWATMRTCGGFLRASNFKFSTKKKGTIQKSQLLRDALKPIQAESSTQKHNILQKTKCDNFSIDF